MRKSMMRLPGFTPVVLTSGFRVDGGSVFKSVPGAEFEDCTPSVGKGKLNTRRNKTTLMVSKQAVNNMDMAQRGLC